MGLILPAGPSFAHWTHNLTDVSSGTAYGTALTMGVSGADGSAATLLSALSHDVEYLVLTFMGFGQFGQNGSTLFDLLIDPAGGTSWSSLIDDLIIGYGGAADFASASNGSYIPSKTLCFPLWIPAGASLGMRARYAGSSAPSATPRVVVMAAGGNKNPASWWCGQKVETIGVTASTSCVGTSVTPGSSGSFGSWTNLGSATSGRAGAVQWMVQGPGGTSITPASAYCYEFGAGSTRIGPPVYLGGHTQENTLVFPTGPIFCDIPSGTQLQAKGAASASSPQAFDCAAYLVQ